jgi:hypothetical protein
MTTAWSTPRRLRAYLVAIAGATAVLLFFAQSVLSRERQVIRTMGKDSAPSVILAEQIYAELADVDANVGNTLLGNPAHRATAEEILEKRRTGVTSHIVDAAENITFGDAEKGPILRLANGWAAYLDRIGEVRVRRLQGDATGAAAQYFDSSRFLHAELLPAVRALDAANRAAFDAAYEAQAASENGTVAAPIALGAALCATLLAAQFFCFRRMRRVVNPALAAATLLSFALTLYLALSFSHVGRAIHGAKADAFESIHTLWKARAMAYDANGEETRWLLDVSPAGGHDTAFDADVLALTSAPLAEMTPTDAKGLFADEIHNITYDGEREGAEAMVSAFAEYHRIDRQIREREWSGRHADAVDLCLGRSNDVFERFDRTLGDVIQINQTQFERLLAYADGAARVAQGIALVFALAIAGLAALGIRARLREYNG